MSGALIVDFLARRDPKALWIGTLAVFLALSLFLHLLVIFGFPFTLPKEKAEAKSKVAIQPQSGANAAAGVIAKEDTADGQMAAAEFAPAPRAVSREPSVSLSGIEARLTIAPLPEIAVETITLDKSVAGDSQREWIQRYWVWARSFPSAEAPSADKSGSRCAAGQSGAVWFLTGSTESSAVQRECVIPARKTLLVPIINTLAQVTTKARAGVEADCANLLTQLARMDATAHALYIKIDGVALKSPGQYFSGTGCFDLHDAASGQSGLAAGSGYWVFVPPLAKGAHELQFGGRFSADNFSQRITYNLDVQ